MKGIIINSKGLGSEYRTKIDAANSYTALYGTSFTRLQNYIEHPTENKGVILVDDVRTHFFWKSSGILLQEEINSAVEIDLNDYNDDWHYPERSIRLTLDNTNLKNLLKDYPSYAQYLKDNNIPSINTQEGIIIYLEELYTGDQSFLESYNAMFENI